MKPWMTSCAVAGLLVLGMSAAAQKPAPAPVPAPADHPKDRAAIAVLGQAFGKSYSAADAKALAALFAPDAQLIDDGGEVVEGRAAIEARFAEGFKGAAGRKVELAIPSIRFLGDSAALADGLATLRDGDDVSTVRSKLALQARDGTWSFAQVHDLPAAKEPEPETNYERLKELEWLVGDWVEESKDVVVRTSWQWSENKNFLVGHFEMKRDGQDAPLTGSQRIGWDPLTKQLKSWTFDSHGGYGEGLWSRRGDDQWIVKAEGVVRDGQTASTTQTLTRLPNNRASWSFTDRVAGGEALPDVEPLVVVRQPPKPK